MYTGLERRGASLQWRSGEPAKKEGGRLAEGARGNLQVIYQSSRRMKALIDSLLDFPGVARFQIRRAGFDLSAMAKAVASEWKLAQPQRRISFRIARGITGNGDAALCRIVLDNLIGNACRHTGKRLDTVIEIGITELAGKPVHFVSDNGPGFEMADAGKLFLPFQRISETGTGGQGIGLATVKRIVQGHGGRVWAESAPGEGATFFYTLE